MISTYFYEGWQVGSQRVITIYHSYPPVPQQKLTAGLGDSYPEMTELFTGGRSLEDPSVFMLVSEFISEDWEKSNYGKSPCYYWVHQLFNYGHFQ